MQVPQGALARPEERIALRAVGLVFSHRLTDLLVQVAEELQLVRLVHSHVDEILEGRGRP